VWWGNSGSEGMCNILHGSGNIHSWRSVKEGAGHVFATAHGAIVQ
jgi:hypothetical protein